MELMELVEELTNAKVELAEAHRDLETARVTIENQMKALLTSNPQNQGKLERARASAAELFEQIMPQVTPRSELHKSIQLWFEVHSFQGNKD